MAKKDNIASRVKEAVKPLVEGAGYTLWDVTFYKEVSEWILEVSIDKEEGISTDDCSLVTKLIDNHYLSVITAVANKLRGAHIDARG